MASLHCRKRNDIVSTSPITHSPQPFSTLPHSSDDGDHQLYQGITNKTNRRNDERHPLRQMQLRSRSKELLHSIKHWMKVTGRRDLPHIYQSHRCRNSAATIKRRNQWMPYIRTIFHLVALYYLVYKLRNILFGIHPFPGGLFGQFVDYRIRMKRWKETLETIDDEIHLLNLSFDGMVGSSKARSLNMPNAVLRETILRAHRQNEERSFVENYSNLFWSKCRKNNQHNFPSNLGVVHDQTKFHLNTWSRIPRFIFRPKHPMWYGPFPSLKKNLETVTSSMTFTSNSTSTQILIVADDNEQHDFFNEPNAGGNPYKHIYNKLPTKRMKTQLWIISALYYYGGIYLAEGVRRVPDSFVNIIEDVKDSARSTTGRNQDKKRDLSASSCPSTPHGYVRMRRSRYMTVSEDAISSFMFTPGHPFLECVLDSYAQLHSAASFPVIGNTITILSWFADIIERDLKLGSNQNLMQESGFVAFKVPITCSQDPFSDSPLFQKMSFYQENADHNTTSEENVRKHNMLVGTYDEESTALQKINVIIERNTKEIGVKPLEGIQRSTYEQKVSLDDRIAMKCSRVLFLNSWLCHRCLRAVYYGSYSRCRWLCGSCLEDIMCSNNPRNRHHGKNEVVVNVTVQGWIIDNDKHRTRLIPRVIHQTWSEDLNPTKYPQLFRLQNSWQSSGSGSGWKYKFYTDELARFYIEKNFPVRFLNAYDALIPGAYKADLFRYLVLLKEGGVYSDIDVLLEVNLDNFITPAMSFFAPRDAVGEYANGQYCLWNGLIGAAPGHPFLVKAVERLINMILDKADILDLERDICHISGKDSTETWKVRAVPELLLSGPCGLGVSINEALHKDPTARFEVGWITPSAFKSQDSFSDLGDVMILMQDKNDLGAMRFTDVERNILVASTDMPGLSKLPLSTSGSSRKSQGRKHYSLAAMGSWLWGTRDIYNNMNVSNEYVNLQVYVK